MQHKCHYTRQVCLASTLSTVKTSINSPGKNSGDIFLRLYSDLLLDSRQASKNGCKRPMYITLTASAHWNVYSQCFTELWKLMKVVFNNKKRNKCFLINTDVFPRRPSCLFRQTVRTFTLEHLISYTVGLGFLLCFSFYLLPGSGGCSGGIRSVPRCPLIPHNGNSSRKGTFL